MNETLGRYPVATMHKERAHLPGQDCNCHLLDSGATGQTEINSNTPALLLGEGSKLQSTGLQLHDAPAGVTLGEGQRQCC